MSGSDDNSSRPSPDQLLTLVQRDQKKEGRGHLKVFLGMVAGVGKTYAMLTRARQLKAQNVDVVIGWVDTHGRKDTEALVAGLECIPRKKVIHRGVEISELDLDAILKRRPKVVLVDELAHTNAPGQRHEKRYLDVLEILKNGIDVFTAVNIQHVESRVDMVKAITGITVHETVPDSILDEADEIALIDVPPEDLLQRLKEGRIYAADRAETASRNFFTRGNLTALREIALRTATDRVDRDLRDFKTLHGIEEAWKSSSRLLVAIFASPYSDTLIRGTRQLAETLKGTWIGLYVDTGETLAESERLLLERNTQLVRQLGGEFLAIQDQSLVEGILRTARQQNVTQIIVGKTQRSYWRNLFTGGSIVHRLLRKSGDIDVYAVAADKGKPRSHKALGKPESLSFFPWGESGWLIAAIAASWGAAALFEPLIGYESIGVIFLMGVTLCGLKLSRVSVFILAVVLSVIHNFFFIPPLHTLSISDPRDVFLFFTYFVAASTVGHLTTRLRVQNRLIQRREDKAVQLFKLAHGISEAKDLDQVVALGIQTLEDTFEAEVSVLFFSEDGVPTPHPKSSFVPSEKELAVAQWVRVNKSPAGRSTETLPSSKALYFPVESKGVVFATIGLLLPLETVLDYERRNLAQALVVQINSGMERERLHENRQRLEVLEQADKLYHSLFDSVSHELKTPLTTIKGVAYALKDASPALVRDLAGQLESETQRLLEVVDNMLDMTRVESGSLTPKLELVDIADILGPALKKLGPSSERIRLEVDPEVSTLRCDASLTVQALVNILRNALMYSGKETKVGLNVEPFGKKSVVFRILDKGPGLPTENTSRVFDRFYRANPQRAGGVGLGLSIAKGFIECQAGSIRAANHSSGGAEFQIELPAGEA